jgi:hypothetical protein
MAAGSLTMRKLIAVLLLFASTSLIGCDDAVGEYVAASSISSSGLAKRGFSRHVSDGQTIKVWGYVDHGNAPTDRCTTSMRDDPAEGVDPPSARWRFKLKARANDSAGESFAVCAPLDDGAAELQRRLLADAAAGRPTRVFVRGRIFTFDAPTNYSRAVGLYMDLESSADVLLTPAAAEQ